MIVTFNKYEAANSLPGTGLPQTYFDQLIVIRGHIQMQLMP